MKHLQKVERLFIKAGYHQNGFSPNQHRDGFSPNLHKVRPFTEYVPIHFAHFLRKTSQWLFTECHSRQLFIEPVLSAPIHRIIHNICGIDPWILHWEQPNQVRWKAALTLRPFTESSCISPLLSWCHSKRLGDSKFAVIIALAYLEPEILTFKVFALLHLEWCSEWVRLEACKCSPLPIWRYHCLDGAMLGW